AGAAGGCGAASKKMPATRALLAATRVTRMRTLPRRSQVKYLPSTKSETSVELSTLLARSTTSNFWIRPTRSQSIMYRETRWVLPSVNAKSMMKVLVEYQTDEIRSVPLDFCIA